MSEQFSILSLLLKNAPDVESRMIVTSVTGAHIAGLPLHAGEVRLPLGLQKIPARIHRHFGDVPHVVIEPELKSHSFSSNLSFPKVEQMSFMLDPDSMRALVVVWYGDDSECLLSAENRRKIEFIDWNSVAKKVVNQTE